MEIKDECGRITYYNDGEGFTTERMFDDTFDTEIPYYVVEFQNGEKVYEREGNMEFFPVKRKVFIRNHPKEEK